MKISEGIARLLEIGNLNFPFVPLRRESLANFSKG
jgi:hypothetical protein